MMLFPSTLFAYRPELRSETSLRGLHLYARIKTSRKWSYLTRVTRKPPPPPNIQTCRGVHLHILSRWLQNKPSQTAMETFASRVVKTRPGDLSVTPASLRKTRASRLCVKNKSWHCRRTVQHPPPHPPHAVTGSHDTTVLRQATSTSDWCSSTVTLTIHRLLQRMSEHLPARSHMKDTRMRSAGGELNFKKIYLSDRWDGLIVNDRYIYNIKRKIITITDKPRDRMDAVKKQLVLDLFIYLHPRL